MLGGDAVSAVNHPGGAILSAARFVKRFPFTLLLLLGLALGLLSDQLGVQYDSGGPESLLFYLSLILAFPIWIGHELLHSSDFTRALYVSKLVPLALGLAIALTLDYLVSLLRAAWRK